MEENVQLQVDITGKEFLREAAKWAYFLSILGFVFIGLMALFSLFAGTMMSSAMGSLDGGVGMMSGAFLTVFYLLLALLYFFPVLYLFRFASNMKQALQMDDQQVLNNAFGSLKSHYKFVGIMTIVMISVYIIGIIIAVAFFASMAV